MIEELIPYLNDLRAFIVLISFCILINVSCCIFNTIQKTEDKQNQELEDKIYDIIKRYK